MKVDVKKIEKLEKKLAELCEEIYLLNTNGRRIIPLHPWLLVRVLPKEHRTESGLFIPGNISNKPVYEAIVLETWQPYVEHRVVKFENGDEAMENIYHAPDVKVGDRVLFPHWEGQPLPDYLGEKYYRMIREGTDQNKNPYCSVYGTLNYQSDASKVKDLKDLMQQFASKTLSGTTDPKAPHWEPPASKSMFTS